MTWVLVDSSNVVQNVIDYDGVTPYTPAAGLTLVSLTITPQVGDTVVNDVVTVMGANSLAMQPTPVVDTPQYPTTDQYTAAIYARDILNDGGDALTALQSQVAPAVTAQAAVPVSVVLLQSSIVAMPVSTPISRPVLTTPASTV